MTQPPHTAPTAPRRPRRGGAALRLGSAAAVVAASLVALAGCGSGAAPAPPVVPSAPPSARPTTAAPGASSTPTRGATPTAGTPSTAELPQARVTNVKVTEVGSSIQVDGTLLDAEGRPIVGAVGDFFIEGSTQNLVQSYATKVDGSFASAFTTKELPPEATLMMHFRGDSSTAPGTFLLRRGAPRTASPAPQNPAPQTPAQQASPSPGPAAPAATQRPVALTDPDGNGRPRVTLAGSRAHIEGRLITSTDGHPVRGATVTWRAGSTSGQAQSAADGAFAFDVDLPAGTREIALAYAGAPDRAPASVTVTP